MTPGKRGPSGMELAGLSIFLAVAFLVPLLLGLVADLALHTSPAFLGIGLVVGIIAAGAGAYTRFKRYL